MISHGEDCYNDGIIINSVNYAVLVVDASWPLASKRETKSLGFVYTCVGMLSNVGNQSIDFLNKFNIATSNEMPILLLCLASENYSVHAMRFKKSSTDSSWAWV